MTRKALSISIAVVLVLLAGAVATQLTRHPPAREMAADGKDAPPPPLPPTPAATPDIYALVIGIDHYKNPNLLLDGAVNDAKVVAEALRNIGAKEVVEIMDGQATRDNISNTWKAITAKAKRGDIVVFSYAGHGAQSAERIPGNEEDGKDEYFVLANFEADGPGTYERIVDDDLQVWFNQVPHLKVVLLADSCHSGTMTRGYQQSKLKYRKANVAEITHDALPPPENKDVADERKTPLAHVVSLSAVADHELDPEVEIEGKPHGALSWYFAKGLHGGADANHDGKISAIELKDYLYEKVKMETDGQQHPQFRNADAKTVVKAVSNPGDTAKQDREATVPFGFSGSQDAALVGFASNHLKHIKLTDPRTAQLEWDTQQNSIKNNFNDVVYRLVPGVAAANTKAFKRVKAGDDARYQPMVDQVQGVVDKFLFVDTIKDMGDGSLGLSLQPNDKLHNNGEQVTLVVDGMKYPFFTLFNLASDGSVNFLYPSEATDSPDLPLGQPYPLSISVAPPFGADHFIAITSAAPLTELHRALKQADGTRYDLEKLSQTLQTSLKGTEYQVGLHATFTTD